MRSVSFFTVNIGQHVLSSVVADRVIMNRQEMAVQYNEEEGRKRRKRGKQKYAGGATAVYQTPVTAVFSKRRYSMYVKGIYSSH